MCVARTGSYFEFRAKNRKEEESLWLVSLRGLVNRSTYVLWRKHLCLVITTTAQSAVVYCETESNTLQRT